MKAVCMIGEGAWGTAVATLLAANGYNVNLWCHDSNIVQEIKSERCNERYLPNILLDEKIKPTHSLKEALTGVKWVFEAVPVKYLRTVLEAAQEYVVPDQVWVILSKGIEQDTLLLPTQILDEIFDVSVAKVVFAGPSFAREVATQQITAVSIAADNCEIGLQVQKMVANDFFRPYIATDVIGVQVGAALKNVITLGVGMLEGAGYSENAKAFFLTRGLYEMRILAEYFSGKPETVYGLSGVGDLILTALGKLSRNLIVGRNLGAGKPLNGILEQIGHIPEGINTVESVYQFIQKNNIELPICRSIYEVIFSGLSVEDMLKQLMALPLEFECEQ